MLKALRGKKSGLFVKIVLGIIVIGFSFFGIESYFVARVDTSVARVGDGKVSQEQYRERMNQYRQRMTQMMGGSLDASYFERPEVRHQIIEQLVNEEVLLQTNDKLGIRVPDEQIRQEILSVPAFQKDGKFDPDTYKAMLYAQGMTPASFDQRVRDSLAATQLPNQIGASVVVTDPEVDEYLKLRDQKRDFRFVKLDTPAIAESNIGEADLKTYYDAHSKEFVTPELVSLDYVELDGEKIDVPAAADEATLKERYEKEKSRFVTPEQRLASHILIKVEGDGGPDAQKAALAKAKQIEDEAKSGKDFAELAKKYSDDLGSKNQGGDLGWLEKGMTDEAFESALFAMKKGEISDPVHSSEGYHVIDLRDVREGKTETFEQARPELEREYAATERDRLYAEKAGRLTDLTYQDPSSLEPAAKELGLTVQKTGLFPRAGGTGIAANPKVLRAAFSDSVLVQNNNSDPIELGTNHIAVVRVAEHKAATPKPFDQVRDQVKAKVLAERTAKAAEGRAHAMFDKLDKGTTLEDVATSAGSKVESEQGIGRDAVNLDSALVKAVFEMPRPKDGGSERRVVSLGKDAYAIVVLDKVVDADPSKLDAKTREAARNTLAQNIASTATREFVEALKKSEKIEINEAELGQE